MIFIAARMKIRPEYADEWPELMKGYTEATRAEAGCLWFDWSRSVDDPNEYVLLEGFKDGDAGGAHVNSEHFKAAIAAMPRYLLETPRIVNFMLPQDDWSLMSELSVS